MKTASGPLVALLNSNVFVPVDLYEVTLASGQVLRLAGSDRAVTYDGQVYAPAVVQRNGVQWSAELIVDTLDVDLAADAAFTVGGSNLAAAARRGAFDGARLKLYRGFFNAAGALVDALVHFEGSVEGADPTTSGLRLGVKSELAKLELKLPTNLYQPGCSHAFLDFGCDPAGTLRAAVTSPGSVLTATTTDITFTGNAAPNFWQLGVVRFTSGACAGLRRAVKASLNAGANQVLTLSVPLPVAPSPGDLTSTTRGCDRTLARCQAYANQARFRGYPYVPRPEDAR